MHTVLVTGGAGFIGSHLVDRLLDDGAAVRVLDNLSTGSLLNLEEAAWRHKRDGASPAGRLEVIIGDVRDRELLRRALRNVKYVVHLAALPSSRRPRSGPSEVHEVNVEGTLNVLDGSLTEGVWRVVLASCASVYGMPETVPVAEEAPLRPTSLFAASKVAAETYGRAFHARHQLDTVVLRYFTVYGVRQRAGVGNGITPALLEGVRRGRVFTERDERSAEDFTYVTDAVAATVAAMRAPRADGRVINVGSGQMVSIRDVQGIIGDLLGTPVRRGIPPNGDAPVYQICAQTTLARELLDFAPRVSLVAGLAEMVRSVTEAAHPATLAPVGFDD
jgi:nucleoside-diphosphate-sugar epimerase